MLHVDPWEAAADYERAAQDQSNNPEHWAIYTHLRDLWIALANERNFLNEHEFEHQVENIIRIEADMVQALAVAKLSDHLLPESNIKDMKTLIAGGTSGRNFRDELLIAQAVAVALALRTQSALAKHRHKPPRLENATVWFNNQTQEFTTLFELAKLVNAGTFAFAFVETLDRFAQAECE